MTQTLKDIPASIHAKLSNEAKRLNRPFTEILQFTSIERFLFRLSKTAYGNKFVLKGGLLFYCWETPLRRPTRDIDFRGYVKNTKENIDKIIREVCSMDLPEDGLIFDVGSIEITETQVDADYAGIRVKFIGYLGKSKIFMQVDMGFSDPITPGTLEIEYPSLLPGMPHTKLKGYPPETVISEKYHAMVDLGEKNSRMKDYYDLWLLTKNCHFKRELLRQAIKNTFKNRSTGLPISRPPALSHEFAIRNQRSWEKFLGDNKISSNEITDFSRLIDEIWNFLAIPSREISASSAQELNHWVPGKGWM